jgi:uncharacterized membrane protein
MWICRGGDAILIFVTNFIVLLIFALTLWKRKQKKPEKAYGIRNAAFCNKLSKRD